jgi:hypothetical protein
MFLRRCSGSQRIAYHGENVQSHPTEAAELIRSYLPCAPCRSDELRTYVKRVMRQAEKEIKQVTDKARANGQCRAAAPPPPGR